jgi:hypothetical protein
MALNTTCCVFLDLHCLYIRFGKKSQEGAMIRVTRTLEMFGIWCFTLGLKAARTADKRNSMLLEQL